MSGKITYKSEAEKKPLIQVYMTREAEIRWFCVPRGEPVPGALAESCACTQTPAFSGDIYIIRAKD